MAKKSNSKQWLKEHHTDPFVKQAKKEGYRARAAYKLLEIITKSHCLKKGDVVLDLGAAPGSWSQVAQAIIGKNGKIIASDILPMATIDNVEFVLGDFQQIDVYQKILTFLPTGANVVLSDMAPNMSGQLSVDIPRAMYLAELAFEIALKTLKAEGYFCVKLFQGEGFDAYISAARKKFMSVRIYKPKASRPRSKEVYLLANRLK